MTEKLEQKTMIKFSDEYGMETRRIIFNNLILDYEIGSKVIVTSSGESLSGLYGITVKSTNGNIKKYNFKKIRNLSEGDIN